MVTSEDDYWLADERSPPHSNSQPKLSYVSRQNGNGNDNNDHRSTIDLLSSTNPAGTQLRSASSTADTNSGSENPFLQRQYEIEMDSLDPQTGKTLSTPPSKITPTEQTSRFDIRNLWSRYILRRKPKLESYSEFRQIIVCDTEHAKHYSNNYVSTTKYNVATFIPKFLFEQFSKNANLFFLATALIQQVPNVSPTNRYTTIGTLIIVLLVSAVKELAEDWRRWKSDKELNNSQIFVLSAFGEWNSIRWSQVRVGDIVRVEKDQYLPADVVVLATSEPNGLCYVETANLDGETNLKIKQAAKETRHLTTETRLRAQAVGAQIDSEHPNSSLYTYEGTLKITGLPRIPLGVEQMLLRGTSLRNTGWISGVVVFTGHETKLMRNATSTPIKRTAVEYMMDLQIIFLFIILIALSVMSSLGNVIKLNQWRKSMWYLSLDTTTGVKTFFSDILTYWILFSNLVPISLFVTIDIIKYWHGYLISSDIEMYDEEVDQPAVCRTSSLVEELGQIKHIFSDKTGTLTRNVMEFKACCIAGQVYATEVPDEKKGEFIKFTNIDFLSDPANLQFLVVLATCHTVIPEITDEGRIEYQASSPDEGALVKGAAVLNVAFTERTPYGLTIRTPDGPQLFELLQVCEFNSTRKRMSTVLRCPDGKIRIFTKGADNVIFDRLLNPHQEAEVSSALEEFASLGLRTLVLAQREISESEYNEWSKRYQEASTSLTNRSEKLAEVAEQIEQNLELVGATAIEDKLQDGVPETIAALQDAGIKIWVLTGDRQETAINIGMSSKLLSEDMSLLLVNESSLEATKANLKDKLNVLWQAIPDAEREIDSLALVIDGDTLTYALDSDCADDFLKICTLCKSVICCRVSPLQKALVVKLAKHKLNDLLLAIGDGANDVSMIQAAHVGVGICGVEGQQAARSADIAISQFRFLKKLLLVHGMWSYNRLSRAILYSFYKNIALYLTQFWYVFYNGFSGESIYESWTVTFYNVFSTCLPPFAIGILDQFVSAKLLLRYPQLYRIGQRGAFLNTLQFWEWILNGIYHSALIFWFTFGAYKAGNVLPSGLVANHWTWGAAMYTACVFTALGKAALINNIWNTFSVIAIPGSAALWLIGYPLYAEIGSGIGVGLENRGVIPALYPTAVFWAVVFIVPSVCLIRDISWKYWRRMYTPEYYHYVQEIQKYKIADRRPQMDQFQKAIRKVRQVARMRKQRGFAFSASDEGADRVVRSYTTKASR